MHKSEKFALTLFFGIIAILVGLILLVRSEPNDVEWKKLSPRAQERMRRGMDLLRRAEVGDFILFYAEEKEWPDRQVWSGKVVSVRSTGVWFVTDSNLPAEYLDFSRPTIQARWVENVVSKHTRMYESVEEEFGGGR